MIKKESEISEIIMNMSDKLKDQIAYASFAVIMIADKYKSPSWPIDLSMASLNMMLMAHNFGVGSSFIDLTYSRISKYFNKLEIRKRFNIPEDMELFSIILFGIPDEDLKIPQRKPLNEIVHYGRW